MSIALISGATGQDGSYLAELLLSKDYDVYAITRRVASEYDEQRYGRINHLRSNPKYHLISGSIETYQSVHDIIDKVKPDEIYHLAAQSFVSYSFEDEFSTMQTNVVGTHNMLAAAHKIVPNCKFYFAGSSEMYGQVEQTPQTEATRFHPRSVYGVSKVAGFELTRHYRERYGMFCCNGILFNHESERRGMQFVTRKITMHVAAIHLGLCDKLYLGNIDARRDWGHAKDYVYAQYLMLQQAKPDDYVVATGETHTVREFLDIAFGTVEISSWKSYVEHAECLVRPAEVELLLGSAVKAYTKLGWKPETSFQQLVTGMVESDIKTLTQNPNLAKGLGYKV